MSNAGFRTVAPDPDSPKGLLMSEHDEYAIPDCYLPGRDAFLRAVPADLSVSAIPAESSGEH